jgi:hypothetical protein
MPKLMYHDLFAVAARTFSVWPDQSLLGGTATIGNHKIIAAALPSCSDHRFFSLQRRRVRGKAEGEQESASNAVW